MENQTLIDKRKKQALEWYLNKVKTFSTLARWEVEKYTQTTKENMKLKQPLSQGWFWMFDYQNPKTKEKLPYYDAFPLVLVLRRTTNGFIGLNFHYIRPKDRAWFIQALQKYEIYDINRKATRINIKYEQLLLDKKLKYYKPCIKRYLFSKIGRFFAPVYPHEWDYTIFMPTERFQKAPKLQVWAESLKKY